jgi:hypothetical protein
MEFKSGDILIWNSNRKRKHAEFIGYINHTQRYTGYQKVMIHVFGNKKTSIVFEHDLEMFESKISKTNITQKSPFEFSI